MRVIPEYCPVKLTSTNTTLKSNLLRLIRKYDNISFGMSWTPEPNQQSEAKAWDARAAMLDTIFYEAK